MALEQDFNTLFEREVSTFMVATGTAANALCLSVLAPPWNSILCHPQSHINTGECGAPEFFTGGAKLMMVGGQGAKIDTAELRKLIGGTARGIRHLPV